MRETCAVTELSQSAASPPPNGSLPSWLRLLFIPLVIVAAIVLIWAILRWPARRTVSPRDLVRELGPSGKSDWQQAYALAELLADPEHGERREDAALAAELAALLQVQLDAGEMDVNRIQLRVFLCRALGEFAVPTGLPVLIQAARQERNPAEIAVRRAALEALAALADRVGPRPLQSNKTLIEILVTAARDHGPGAEAPAQRAGLRASAAFGLGVLGGEPSLEELQRLLDDPCPNVRYNAAAGLARHGRAAAIPMLLTMLDPNNADAVADETSAAGRAWKRSLVWTNGIRAATQLAERNPAADCRPLATALEVLVNSEVPDSVRGQARELLRALRKTPRE